MRPSKWRLLDTGPREGALNMAIDAAILRRHGAERIPPTLHVYDWDPTAISVGRMQKIEAAVDLEACLADELDVVRRPTGGRAVLHGDDFTFSVITPADGFIPATVEGSYAAMAEVAETALRRLGARAELGRGHTHAPRHAACFATATRADIMIDGTKILGGAQRWERRALLQQNSLLLAGDPAGIFRYLRPARGQTQEAAAGQLRSDASTLEEVLGSRPSRREVRDALADAMHEVLGVTIEEDRMSQDEERTALALRAEYAIASAPGKSSSGDVASPPTDMYYLSHDHRN